MKSILKDTNNSEKLLNMVSDTLILMDKDGVCVDIAIHNVDLWFIKEKRLLGKNLLSLLPSNTYREFYPEFKKVLLQKTKSIRNYELTLRGRNYFFKCIMQPYGDLILCQYRDITERSQRKLELERKIGNCLKYKRPRSLAGGYIMPTPRNSAIQVRQVSCVRKQNKVFSYPTT